MAEQDMCVSWKDHANELTTAWKTSLANNSFVDCTISAEGKSLKAHRLILSACSSYFRMLFCEEQEKHPIVILKDTSFDTLKAVIEFVYYGKAEISENHLEAFLELAESLQIKDLNNSLQKEGTDLHSKADGSVDQCASGVKRDICEVESSWSSHEDNSNSFQQHPYLLLHDFSDTTQEHTTVPFQIFTNSCKKMQSVVMPVQDHQRPVSNDPEVSINTEINVKQESVCSEVDVLEIKKEVLEGVTLDQYVPRNFRSEVNENLVSENNIFGHQSSPVHKEHQVHQRSPVWNDSESFISPEISVKHSPIYSEMDLLKTENEVLDSVSQNESVSGNFGSVTNDGGGPALEQDFDQYSCRTGSSEKGTSALVIPLGQLPHHYQQQEQHQPHQQMQQEQQPQDITHLSCQSSSTPEFTQQHLPLLPELNVPVSEKTDDAVKEESMDVPGNDYDEVDEETESTLDRSLNPYSSAEYILPDAHQASQRRSGRQLRQHKNNSFAAPLEHQEAASGKTSAVSGRLSSQTGRRKAERRYGCDMCGKTFPRPAGLVAHKRVHTGERPFVCQVCGKSFSQSDKLNIHKRVHSGERPFVCQVCGEAFKGSGNLCHHKRTHLEERPFMCQVCGKSFVRQGTLDTHMRVHTGERPFVCQVCGKSFRQSGTLDAHKRVHTGERPFVCELCGKSFIQSSGLLLHKRRHTGERPFKCDICGKTFIESRDLRKHKNVHTDHRPHECQVCGKTFSRLDNFNSHKRTHTGSSQSQALARGRPPS